jgi:hypothetical protein
MEQPDFSALASAGGETADESQQHTATLSAENQENDFGEGGADDNTPHNEEAEL